METGRIDVHAHLIPGVDDGCQSVEDALACARMFVEAGYTHAFCTPHVWPSLERNTGPNIGQWTRELQEAIDDAQIPLTLAPGGELNLEGCWPTAHELNPGDVVTYSLAGKYLLFDFWADTLPEYLFPGVEQMLSLGFIPIIAHPERIRVLQRDSSVVERLLKLGLLMQCNTWCLTDRVGTPTRDMSEAWLRAGRYFLLGTDCHNAYTLPIRFEGLRRAIEMVGESAVRELTVINPRKLLAENA